MADVVSIDETKGEWVIEEILEDAKRLVRLLEDPHPGLSSWIGMLGSRAESLRDKLLVVVPLEATPPHPTTLQQGAPMSITKHDLILHCYHEPGPNLCPSCVSVNMGRIERDQADQAAAMSTDTTDQNATIEELRGRIAELETYLANHEANHDADVSPGK